MGCFLTELAENICKIEQGISCFPDFPSLQRRSNGWIWIYCCWNRLSKGSTWYHWWTRFFVLFSTFIWLKHLFENGFRLLPILLIVSSTFWLDLISSTQISEIFTKAVFDLPMLLYILSTFPKILRQPKNTQNLCKLSEKWFFTKTLSSLCADP